MVIFGGTFSAEAMEDGLGGAESDEGGGGVLTFANSGEMLSRFLAGSAALGG